MTRVCALAVLCVGMSLPASAQQYQARRDGDVVRLEDTRHQVVASILPSVGNQAFELKVKGHNVLRWTYASVADFKSRPGMAGIPFSRPGPTSSTNRRSTPTESGMRSTCSLATSAARGRATAF